MEGIYQRIQKMREEQEAEAGLFFSELSTQETWMELLRWMAENPSADFATQMTEVAALAIWALETEASRNASEDSEDRKQDAFSKIQTRFGPLDRPLQLSRSRYL